ncbi:MAG: Hsp70 family protein [Chloroflexi bacterium]|nr:Hsp70 family protein [Chloroflexota bacterium]
MARAIGIDLGTTYTVVATIQEGRPRTVPNAEGQHLTPSVVAFTSAGEPLVGQRARRQAAANPQGTVFSIKRRMGSDYVVKAIGREYTPQEVSGLILRKVKADAEERLGERITQAVITVPAYFNDRQRQATREAGTFAGLEVLRIVNEPTAAALAYGLEREDVHTVLVWDLGGGTFDVSILELGEGIFEVRAVSGDTWLGGDDFDQRVADYLAAEYEKVTGARFPADGGARVWLREVAERAKIELSSYPVTQVHLPPLGPWRWSQKGPIGGVGGWEKLPWGGDSLNHQRQLWASSRQVEIALTREHLERLTEDLLRRMAACTHQAIADSGLSPNEIDRVILVGGATRMPAVRRLAREVIGKEPYRYIDPDEVVAAGAAIQAGMLLGLVEKAVLLDVLPLSLGVETQGGLAARIIPRNSPLPASGARIFTTAADYQPSMDVHVLQGERELALDNISLGQFQLSGIPPAPRGVAKVEVAFEADVDGIVHVSATELLSESEMRVKVASTKHLDPREIGSLANEALHHAEEDREKRQRIEAIIEAEGLMAAGEMLLKELVRPPTGPQSQRTTQALAKLREAMAWGLPEEMRGQSRELRQLLAEAHKEERRPSKSVGSG